MAQEQSRQLPHHPLRVPLLSALAIVLAVGLLAGLTIGQWAAAHRDRPATAWAIPAVVDYQPAWGYPAVERSENPTRLPVVPAKPPTRMKIPVIGLDAASESLPFLGVPANSNNVGWFSNLSAPGENGDAVFDGHLDWTTGPAVFWNLAKLKIGDDIYVLGAPNTRTLHFKIDSMVSVHYLSTPPDWLYSTQGPPQLSLITCDGGWNPRLHVYEQRLLVHSSMVVD